MAKIDRSSETNKPKDKYKVTNWAVYNKGLKQRGSLTLWMEKDLASRWYHNGPAQRGGQFVYSAVCIEWVLTLKIVFRLPFRQAVGFAESVLELGGLTIQVPSPSQVCRRQKDLNINLKVHKLLKSGQALHVVIDSTGVKIYGECEWKVRKHGYSKRRTWRKVHVALDEKTGQMVAVELTDNKTDDAAMLKPLVKATQKSGMAIDKIGADGAYDTVECWEYLQDEQIEPIIPPRQNAALWADESGSVAEEHPRNQALKQIDEGGREANRVGWKRTSGYHRRSKSENGFYRWKVILGERFYSRSLENQKAEARLKAAILNRFIQVAAPQSEKVA